MKARYVWEVLYEAAALEADDKKLSNRLLTAKAAIDIRLEELGPDHGRTPEERQAISDALQGLSVLRTELETRGAGTGSSNA